MKKTGRFRQTVAAFMAAMAMVCAPPTEARVIENANSAKEISNPNKNAVTPPKEQGQGIKLNDHTGGMDFD